MIIREKVARAIAVDQSGRDPFDQHAGVDGEWITEEAHKIHCDEWLDCAGLAINAFLAAAAEPDEHGISWHMRPDEATEAMLQGACKTHKVGEPMAPGADDRECPYIVGRRYKYRAMLAAAPKFEREA